MCIDDSSYFSEWFIVKGRKNGKLVEYIEYTGLVVDELNSKSNYTALQAQQILKCSVILEHYYDLSAQYDSLLIQYYRKIFSVEELEQPELEIVSEVLELELTSK